jgi:hypothetical protein
VRTGGRDASRYAGGRVSQPAFTEHELVLVLDYYLARARGEPRSLDELSSTLRGLGLHRDPEDPVAFRNADGLARAARRFRLYEGMGIDRDTPAYRRVWERYSSDPAALSDAVKTATNVGGAGAVRDGGEEVQTVGRPYEPADETVVAIAADLFPVDPKTLERSLRSHASLQNRLAGELERRGLLVLSPRPDDPPFDLAWWEDGALWVAEVKSLTDENEERQLRLGLGQLLRYRHLLARGRDTVRGLLYVEREPCDPAWRSLCAEIGVRLGRPSRDRLCGL